MSRFDLRAWPRSLLLALGGLTLLALIQQQVLLRRSPRLREVAIQPLRSSAAALDLRFSRPMRLRSLESQSALSPSLAHLWFGADNAWRLLLEQADGLEAPIELRLAASDVRGLPLPPHSVFWDPRPTLLAVVQSDGGEQVQMQGRDGRWLALTDVWPSIVQMEPLGNGRGVAFVAVDAQGDQVVGLRTLTPRALGVDVASLGTPRLGDLEQLTDTGQLFAHVSSNLRGDLIVQAGRIEPGSDQLWLRSADGQRRDLNLKLAGPVRLLPDGTGMVVPGYNGLELLSLAAVQGDASKRQVLPGSRDLRAFCTGSGRALLVRHWPDYRRSVELVIPGLPPRQVWLGEQAVMAVACDNGGERLWVILRETRPEAVDTLLQLDRDGTVVRQRTLGPWRLAPNSGLHFDPVDDQLLLTLIRSRRSPGRIGWIDADTLALRTDASRAVVNALWLPAAGRLDRF